MQVKRSLYTVWRSARWPLAVVVVGFVALVAWRLHLLYQADDTSAAVAAIHANHLTQDDVFGPLPKAPDQAQNDATLAGVDSNNNGIRDDVERAIYFKYQASAKEAAPAYQYAKALQMEFTRVYNSPTLVAVTQEEGRASLCLADKDKKEEIRQWFYNTEARIRARDNLLEKYMTSYTLLNTEECDISLP